MSCFFCYNNDHFSQNCNKYQTDIERWDLVNKRSCCPNCLNFLNQQQCNKCEAFQKCYICFSKDHHTVYCRDRFKVSNIFAPKINYNLYSRFLGMSDPEERYSLTLSVLAICNLITLKPLKVKYIKNVYYFSNTESIMDFDLLSAGTLCMRHEVHDRTLPQKFDRIMSIHFRFEHIDMYRATLPSQEFFKFLSHKTKSLKCLNSTVLEQTLTLREILANAPNLEMLEIYQTNIEIDDNGSWLDDLLQLNCAEKLKQIHLSIPSINFSIESLVNLMKKKQVVEIHLCITYPPERHFDEKLISEKIKEKFSNFFYPVSYWYGRFIKVTFEHSGSLTKLEFIYKLL